MKRFKMVLSVLFIRHDLHLNLSKSTHKTFYFSFKIPTMLELKTIFKKIFDLKMIIMRIPINEMFSYFEF